MSNIVTLPWGKETIDMTLPESWQVKGRMEPAHLEPAADALAEVERSLVQPVGMLRLGELAQPGMKIAIVMDDSSRPTPVGLILPAVLKELTAAGVPLDKVTLVPALGLHRPMPADEIIQRIAPQSLEGLRYENPDGDDPGRLTDLGVTSRGTPVLINRTVATSDLVITIGCIEPHIIASFGGGYKNIVPGVAGRATIAHNHSLNCQPQHFNNVGQPIEKNPMRLDLEEAAGKLKPPVFIVNAVLNSALQVVRVVAGHPVQAHRAGVETSARIYGVPVPGLAEVVITDSHPMDQDLRQGVKALTNTIRALKPGGVQIVLGRAEEGVGVFGLANKKLPLRRGALKLLAPVLLPLVPKLKLKGMGEEDKFFLYFALQAMRRGTLLIYAPTIPRETRANLPFVTFVDSVEEAVAIARSKVKADAGVLLFPHGGSTYPILP